MYLSTALNQTTEPKETKMYRIPSDLSELELMLADSQAEGRLLRHRLDIVSEEALRLRQKLEQIYTVAYLALDNRELDNMDMN